MITLELERQNPEIGENGLLVYHLGLTIEEQRKAFPECDIFVGVSGFEDSPPGEARVGIKKDDFIITESAGLALNAQEKLLAGESEELEDSGIKGISLQILPAANITELLIRHHKETGEWLFRRPFFLRASDITVKDKSSSATIGCYGKNGIVINDWPVASGNPQIVVARFYSQTNGGQPKIS